MLRVGQRASVVLHTTLLCPVHVTGTVDAQAKLTTRVTSRRESVIRRSLHLSTHVSCLENTLPSEANLRQF